MRTRSLDGNRTESLWNDAELPRFDTTPEAETEVCIVGGGITGLTTALVLARDGVHATVLDDGPLGGGETGRTSAHLASAVDDRYYQLETRFGERGAQLIAESHAAAIDWIEATVREHAIDCDFRRIDGYLIAAPGERRGKELDKELVAAQRAGLEVARIDRAPLPFDTGPALRFARQAEFHPLRYLRGLAEAAVRAGVKIHTGVHVTGIEPGQPLTVRLADHRSMLCRAAVDATGSTVTSMVKLPLRQAAYRSYVLAFELPDGAIPHALFWDTAHPYHYLRVVRRDDRDVLIVGGADHRTGQGDASSAWEALETWTRHWLPQAGAIVARWSGQIIEPVDGPAHIGRSPDVEHVYIATGDSGNGLTHGTIAGLLLPQLMRGHRPAWAAVYDPARSHMHALGTFIREAASSSMPYSEWLRAGDVRSIDQIPPGSGAIVRRGLHFVAAYRDADGQCHLSSATCPHLRGVVRWNDGEQTWDCPCHGSRFDPYGRVLNGPAVTDLAPIEEPAPRDAPARERPQAPVRLRT
jgi:glycine/D-amino acid oxidase-like deaminating enzyme/nitrite reductase/ring-hydroxylating ferredoxin subunit